MKLKYVLILGANILLASLTPLLAQSSWKTAESLPHLRGRDIAVDPTGTFFALMLDDSTSTTGPVFTSVVASSDQGANWETVGLIGGYAVDLAIAPDGAIFATGNRSATISGRAFLWQSLDHGRTWTISEASTGLPSTMLVLDVAAGSAGSIYICGTSGGAWLIRKGQRTTAGSLIWSTVDSIPGFPANQPDSLCIRPGAPGQADEILVCGRVSGLWTVRRSVNDGASWATVDSYAADMQLGYSGVTTAPDGSIYVVGRVARTISTQTVVKKKIVVTTTTEYGWLIRKSANRGASWSNVDYLANGWPGNAPITVDAFGRIFVVGFDNATTQSWLVRASSDGGATWVTTDSFLSPDSYRSQAWGIASDLLGNVCVVGEATSGTSSIGPIRRLAAP